MPKAQLPVGIHDKLSLAEPDTWNVDDFQGYERMAVSRGNTVLETIFRETRTQLPKLVASVRWSQLRYPYREFAIACGMSPNGYKPMEQDQKPRSAPHREKYTKLLHFWEKQGISSGIREQLLDLLTVPELLETHPESADVLDAMRHMRSEAELVLGIDHMTAFYHRIGYDVGHDSVEAKFHGFYNTAWQRERTGTVPDYRALLELVHTMYAGRGDAKTRMRTLRLQQAEVVWEGVKRKQYLDRTLEPVLADMLIAMERHIATTQDATLTAETLRDTFGFGPMHSQHLIQCELIEPEAMSQAMAACVPAKDRKEMQTAWADAFEAEQQRGSFRRLCQEAMAERGYTAADVANILGVQAPEDRGKEPVEREYRYRPDSEVRGVLLHNQVSRQIAVEAMVQVVARDAAHADTLRQAYIYDRTRFFQRTGARLSGDGLRMRIARELANISMAELALQFLPKKDHGNVAVVRAKDLELQRLERNEGKAHTITHGKVDRILQGIASKRAQEAMDRAARYGEISPETLSSDGVQSFAQQLIAALKTGAGGISDAMRDMSRKDDEWLRSDLITAMAEGTFVPTLPQLRLMAKSTADAALPQEVLADWHARFPQALSGGVMLFGTVTKPLPRVLCTLIAMRESNPITFFKDRVPGVVPTVGTKHLRSLEAEESVDWKYIHKYLLACGLQPGQTSYRLAKLLHENGGNTSAAIRELMPALAKARLQPSALTLPGLLPEELEQKKKK